MTSSALPETKAAGAALALGVILLFFALLFLPGGVLIDPVDQTDFPVAIAAMADNANISHAMTLLVIIAIMLEAYGLLALLRSTRKEAFQTQLCDSGWEELYSAGACTLLNWARGTW